MFIRTNCDRKSQFSGISTEPLNPHDIRSENTENTKIYIRI